MSEPIELEQFEYVRAKFAPKRTDDLNPDFDHEYWIGREAEWQASWIIEEGQFAGDWAMVVTEYEPGKRIGWTPLRDLEVIEKVSFKEYFQNPEEEPGFAYAGTRDIGLHRNPGQSRSG